MKKLLLIAALLSFGFSIAQNTRLKANNVKTKYENIYYKSPQKFNNQEQKFVVTKIEFSSSYKGSKSTNMYQISVHGKVNNTNERIIFDAKSIDELKYYKDIFNGRYKKILLFEHEYLIASKKYFDTSIVVEF